MILSHDPTTILLLIVVVFLLLFLLVGEDVLLGTTNCWWCEGAGHRSIIHGDKRFTTKLEQ